MSAELEQRTLPAHVRSVRSLPPTNQPDVAIAQDWLGELDAWVRANGLHGYDPFDIKEHPFIRAAQPHALPRKATTALCDLFPNLLRKTLRIKKTENPKAHALLARARLRLFEMTHDEAYLDEARQHLRWLTEHSSDSHAGLCWGYPFRVYAKGVDTPAGTPVLVVCAIAGQAFLHAYALTSDQQYLDAVWSIARFVVEDIPRSPAAEGTFCFGYTPQDRRRVHNANLLGAELLACVANVTGESALSNTADQALRFTLARQRDDGSWTYGEYDPAEPFDEANLRMIDHHHTGFVLRSLFAIHEAHPTPEADKALWRGFDFYRKHLVSAWGAPQSVHAGYPVDIHACSEAILCPSVLAAQRSTTLQLATCALRWAHWYLRDPRTGATYYRRYRRYTSKLVCPRWGIAWMYLAVIEYIHAMNKNGGDLAPVSGKSW